MHRYIIISPVKNEEGFIQKTIESIMNQTILPYKWIIVNDGSNDQTGKIIEHYTSSLFNKILLLELDTQDQKRAPGKSIIEAFNFGLAEVDENEFDFICKLDGDLILPRDFFERALKKFEQNPRLGITSGISYINKNGKWIPEKAAKRYTFGSSKIYRKQCFIDIGGLVPSMGWDGIDHIKAVMLGWTARTFEDLIQYHLRPTNQATGTIKGAYNEGICCYYMGYHPLFFILRSIKMMFSFPYLVKGLIMFLSYLRCTLQNDTMIGDKEFIKFLRRSQIKRLLLKECKYV